MAKETTVNSWRSFLEKDQLSHEFRMHEKVCEERWKTVFNEIRAAKENSEKDRAEIKASIRQLHHLIWAGGGALILFLAGALLL